MKRTFDSGAVFWGLRLALAAATVLALASALIFCRAPAGRSLEDVDEAAGPELAPSAPARRTPFGFLSAGNVNLEGLKSTYTAGLSGINPITGVNLSLKGSATKTIKIVRMTAGPGSTANGATDVVFYICTSLTGGTPFDISSFISPFDSNNPAATADPVWWTGAPTRTCSIILYSAQIFFNDAGVGANIVDRVFCQNPEQCPTIRGTSQWAAIFFNGTFASTAIDVRIEWTEE